MGGYDDYWAKASADAEGAFHRLTYHALDVAAVGAELLDRVPAHLKRLSWLSGFTPASLRSALPFHLALHDLGKFSESFQDQKPGLVALLQRARAPRPGGPRHDTLGYLLLKQWANGKAPSQESDLLNTLSPVVVAGEQLARGDLWYVIQPWMAAVLGHHGRPPEELTGLGEVFRIDAGNPARSRADAAAFARDLRALLRPEPLETAEACIDLVEARVRRASWWVAGFTILCDWLGSDDEFFRYERRQLSLAAYWPLAQASARETVRTSGLASSRPRAYGGMGTLLPAGVAANPSPLQAAAATVALGDGPQLFVLEDLTGSGKTEAALLLAHRLMAGGCGSGLYFALPTMATANAMAPRVAGLVDRLFTGDPSFLLTHSGPRFTERDRLRIGGAASEASPEPGQLAGAAAAAAWLSDRRKKALLADAGVGTIDQALLAVLQSKHAALRLFGLQQRVLVVDEVHACDAYMLGVLAVLLRAQAALGGSAILLSATLPLGQRRTLAGAFAQGLGQRKGAVPGSLDYPLLTGVSGAGVVEVPVAPRAGVPRRLPVRWHGSIAAVVDRLVEASRQGHCACWIRNSVADALEAHEALARQLREGDLTLFHARFALGDRLAIEESVVSRFGPEGGRRRGHVVVATQVVEQSLDVDFDVLVTDLSPIDRIMQRAGRLQRHGNRHPGRPAPVLEILAPPWSDDPPAGWLTGPFRRTAVVYADPVVLWRTMGALRSTGALSTPEHARSLVEAVFGEDGMPAPAALTRRSDAALGKELADESLARNAVIKLDLGYVREGADWSSEARTPTRLGEPTTTVRLARLGPEGSPAPWFDRVPQHAWALSQVSVARRLVARASPEDAALVDRPSAGEPSLDDDFVTAVLRKAEDGSWRGDAIAERMSRGATQEVPVRLVYSARRGLGIEYVEGR